MILPKRWMTRADWLRPCVTVCWTPWEVSLVLWGSTPDRSQVVRACRTIPAETCTADRFLEALDCLTMPVSKRGLSIPWILLQEAFPFTVVPATQGEGLSCSLPDWIAASWGELPSRVVPQRVGSALDAVERALCAWPDFSLPGTGFGFPLGNRNCFFGYSEHGCFRRVSRLPQGPGQAGILEPDWIRQTRMLYQSRTGYELRRILSPVIPVAPECGREVEGIEVHYGCAPRGWQMEGLEILPASVGFLHLSALRHHRQADSNPALPLLEDRRRSMRLNRHLRLTASLLVCGILAGTLGACRHGTRAGSIDESSIQDWKQEREVWRSNNHLWQESRVKRMERLLPLEMIGKLAGSLPGTGIELDRIHVRQAHEPEGTGVSLKVEGRVEGDSSGSGIRDWVNRLQQETPLRRINNIRLSEGAEGLHFSLEGFAETRRP